MLTAYGSSSDPAAQDAQGGSKSKDLPSLAPSTSHSDMSNITRPSSDRSQPPSVVKKRGRGRPPIYKLSDKRKIQLKEVNKLYKFIDILPLFS